MAQDQDKAAREMKRMFGWIALCGLVFTLAALWYLSLYGPLHTHMVVATIAGVFISVALGCGLFAAAFYSDKSGHDQDVTDAAPRKHDKRD